jgi:thymidylate kinase
MTDHVARIVTFSGIDGAGKTTQIEAIAGHLAEQGHRVARVTFWDDVALLPKIRAGVSLRVLRRKEVPSQSTSLRSDKNVRTWYWSLVRSAFYLLDSLRLRRLVSRLRTDKWDFIIFDRYGYDQLVQVRGRHGLARLYIRLLIAIIPTPDFGFILDAPPDEAFQRKPEYPLSFMHDYRRAFLDLQVFVPELTVIAPDSIAGVRQQILRCLLPGFAVLDERHGSDSPVGQSTLSDFR